MKPLQNLSEIDTNRKEGRYLMAAMATLTTQTYPNETPDKVLNRLYELQEDMYKGVVCLGDEPVKRQPFIKALEELINQYSMENKSNTPDFILAEHLMASLSNLEQTIKERERWYGQELKINNPSVTL